MVEAEASVSSCCPKASYQSFSQHDLFEVVGDSHDVFHVMLAKSSIKEYLMSHLLLKQRNINLNKNKTRKY